MWGAIMSSAISLAFGLVAALTVARPSYLPIAIAVGILTGPACYLIFWLLWNLRSDALTRKGHRW
jgi:hypothetical protein